MQLAIIGAGVAGLAAARALRLRRPDLAITIYEQSRGLGGRAATRRREGFAFDHGAQYVKAPTPELERLLTVELPSEDLLDIGRPVWIFDSAGAIAEGDPAQNAGPKWTYRDGLDRLGKLLGEGLDIRPGVRILSVARRPSSVVRVSPRTTDHGLRTTDAAWTLIDADGQAAGESDLILLTPPAPQAADVLSASDFDPQAKAALLAELARATYRSCVSVALAYDWPIERPFYALVNVDRAHPVSWLALEHDKGPGRCPPGQSLLIAQMAPRWSADHWHSPNEKLEPLVADLVSVLIGENLRAPIWSDIRRWRYALPDSGADFEALNASGSGLYFAGDYTAGQGRVHLAIESGWRAAGAIEQMLE